MVKESSLTKTVNSHSVSGKHHCHPKWYVNSSSLLVNSSNSVPPVPIDILVQLVESSRQYCFKNQEISK